MSKMFLDKNFCQVLATLDDSPCHNNTCVRIAWKFKTGEISEKAARYFKISDGFALG